MLLVLAAACAGDDGGSTSATPTAETTEPGPTTTTVAVPDRAEVEHVTLDLVDTSRPTPAQGGQAASDQRVLPTEVYLPAGTGPFPLIAFSHGWSGHPRKFTQLFQAWADAGYVVAAPTFPLSNDGAPGGATSDDADSQPGDISFVIDEVLAASGDGADPLFGSVDPERIGVAGLSLGGFTTYGVAFGACCRDDRVRAAAVFDGAQAGYDDDLDSGLPLLVVHGDEDYVVPYEAATTAYRAAVAPKWLLTVHEAIHFEPFEDTADPADELVRQATIAFWDRYLRDDESAEERLVDAVAPPRLATLESDLG
jgi:predicted dienelactone hydrolase